MSLMRDMFLYHFLSLVASTAAGRGNELEECFLDKGMLIYLMACSQIVLGEIVL